MTARVLAEGIAIAVVADWSALCEALCAPGTRLVLVDPALPALDAPLLGRLARSLGHKPVVKALPSQARTGPPPEDPAALQVLPHGDRAIVRAARNVAPRDEDLLPARRTLRWAGLGPEPLRVVASLASSPLPVLLHGERGTGKVRLARLIHHLAGTPGAVVELAPEARTLPAGPPSTLYLPAVQLHPHDRVAQAQRAGWRVIAGSRLADPLPDVAWARAHLPPLRERPSDLRELATHYLEAHAARLGTGRRRLDKGAWALLHAHRWPENARELERFLAELVVAVASPRIGADDLPPHLRLRLLPAAPSADELESFEEAARSRLAPAVAAWVPVKDAPSLHNHVIDAAERALVQLALAKTEGNRKAAAQLLGLARNTLHERIVRLGLDGG